MTEAPNGGPQRWPDSPRYPKPEPSGLGLGEIVHMLRRKFWLIVATTAISFGATYYLVSQQIDRYEAEALVRLRDGGAALAGNVLGNETKQAGGSGVDPYLSELLVIRGRRLAGEIVEAEGLRLFDLQRMTPPSYLHDVAVTLPPEAFERVTIAFGASGARAWAAGDSADGAYGDTLILPIVRFVVPSHPRIAAAELAILPLERASDWVLGGLNARQRQGTNVMRLTFASTDPAVSVRMANAAAVRYQAFSAASAREHASRRREFIEEQLRRTDEAFVRAQTALGRFRGREQVYRSDQRAAAAQASMIQLEVRRGEVVAERRIYQTLLAEVEGRDGPRASQAFRTLLSSSAVAGNPVLSQLFGRLTQYETTRDSLLVAGRPAAHEDVVRLHGLIAGTQSRIVEALRSQLRVLDSQIASLEEQRARSASEIQRLSPAELEEVRIAQQVESMRSTGDQLRQEYQRALIAEAVALGNVEIVETATRAVPMYTGDFRKLALGIAFGLFLGGGLALLLEYSNTSINRRAEVEAALQVPGLAVIPQLPMPKRPFFASRRKAESSASSPGFAGRQRRGKNADADAFAHVGLVTVTHTRDRGAEAYRGLRTRLMFFRDQASLRTVVVTSATVGEGKTTTVANVAVALAQQGMRVLLIDGDLRRPRLHTIFGTTKVPGLTDLLSRRASLEDAVRRTSVEGVDLLPRGTFTSQPSEVLGGEWMALALRSLSKVYDIVLIDTPPVLYASDAAGLAGHADGVLFVLRAGKTDRAMAQEAMYQLSGVGARVVGAVLNDPDAKVTEYDAYGYTYA